MNKLPHALAALFFTSCVSASDLPNIEVSNFCALKINGKLTPSPLQGNCEWATTQEGSLQTVTVSKNTIAILIGNPLPKEEMQKWQLDDASYCSYESVGVKLDLKGSPVAISKPITDLLVCKNLHIDHKVFASYRWK